MENKYKVLLFMITAPVLFSGFIWMINQPSDLLNYGAFVILITAVWGAISVFSNMLSTPTPVQSSHTTQKEETNEAK